MNEKKNLHNQNVDQRRTTLIWMISKRISFFFRFFFDRVYERVLAWIFSQRKIQTKSSIHSTISASDAIFSTSSRITLQSVDCNELSQKTIVSAHLIVSQSNAAVWRSDNFASASDRSGSNAASLTSTNNFVSAFDYSRSGAVFLTSENNSVSASDRSESGAVSLTSYFWCTVSII